jgi:SAM-dependent methyltransferase
MAIEAIALEEPEAGISDNVARLIETCSRGWERFFADTDDHEAPRFVPSVPERVFAVLAEVTNRHLSPTRVFCEWGSGFGTATCMAALLGYEAYGLEIEAELVRLSSAIARRLGIPVQILCTSMFPAGYAASSGAGEAALVTPESCSDPDAEERGPLRYDGMAVAVAEIGMFFAYPWPEERKLMQELFDAVAAKGAILVAYHTDKQVHVFRKV